MIFYVARLLSPPFVRVVVLFVATGALLYLTAFLWVGWEQTVDTISGIGVFPLFAFGVLSSTAYLWRFGRWDYALHCLGYRVPTGLNILVYFSGLAFTTSPGKVGEVFRSVLLAPSGVKVPHSVGVFLADRLSDVLGMFLLGIIAGALTQGNWAWLWTSAFFFLFVISLIGAHAVIHPSSGRFWHWVTERSHWLPVRGGQAALGGWARLWTARRALAFSLVAVVAYGIQALVFVALCGRVGVDISSADGVLIFVNATLFGAASMVPGGLGTMEAALILQLVNKGATAQAAVSIAVATRLITLWLGVGLGVTALLGLTRKHENSG